MSKILISPGKYVQGPGALKEIGQHMANLGERVLLLVDPVVLDLFEKDIEEGLEAKDLILENFNGECSKKEIDRLTELANKNSIEVIVGVGGGKTLDTAKAISYYAQLPIVIVPTIAATDAPCSALSVIYTEGGIFEEYLFLPANPNMVLVDSQIIAKAPVRFLVSGMGDALATYFEAEACSLTKAANMPGGTQTLTAVKLAKLCYDTLMEYGVLAKKAAEAGVVTEALEKIIEANTLLSGLGFESGGLAAAHAIHNGLTVLEETHAKTHGEKVAYATIVQLILEDRVPAVITEVIDFCKSIGLPTTLSDLGIEEVNEEDILKVAKASCVETETIHNMPFSIDADMVKDAILAADRLGS